MADVKTLVATPDPDPEPNRVRIDVTFSPSSGYSYVNVERRRSSGGGWRPVRGLTLVPVTEDHGVTAYDYEAPINAASDYRIRPYRLVDGNLHPAPVDPQTITVTTTADNWRIQ